MPFLVRCPIGIDLMFPAHLSLGHNYAEFPYFYLKPPAGQCADLATSRAGKTATSVETKILIICYLGHSGNVFKNPISPTSANNTSRVLRSAFKATKYLPFSGPSSLFGQEEEWA
jgi:hypothetical protein